MDQTWRVGWTGIYVLMHALILTEEWDQRGVTGTCMLGHTGVHMFMHNFVKGDGREVGSQVDMHSYIDACAHSNQGGGPKEG